MAMRENIRDLTEEKRAERLEREAERLERKKEKQQKEAFRQLKNELSIFLYYKFTNYFITNEIYNIDFLYNETTKNRIFDEFIKNQTLQNKDITSELIIFYNNEYFKQLKKCYTIAKQQQQQQQKQQQQQEAETIPKNKNILKTLFFIVILFLIFPIAIIFELANK